MNIGSACLSILLSFPFPSCCLTFTFHMLTGLCPMFSLCSTSTCITHFIEAIPRWSHGNEAARHSRIPRTTCSSWSTTTGFGSSIFYHWDSHTWRNGTHQEASSCFKSFLSYKETSNRPRMGRVSFSTISQGCWALRLGLWTPTGTTSFTSGQSRFSSS